MTRMPVTGHHAWGRAYGHDIACKSTMLVVKGFATYKSEGLTFFVS
jgi:hypothetical protein